MSTLCFVQSCFSCAGTLLPRFLQHFSLSPDDEFFVSIHNLNKELYHLNVRPRIAPVFTCDDREEESDKFASIKHQSLQVNPYSTAFLVDSLLLSDFTITSLISHTVLSSSRPVFIYIIYIYIHINPHRIHWIIENH